MSGGLRFRLLRIVTEAAPVHFGEYGLTLPLKVASALGTRPDAFLVAASLAIGVAVAAWLFARVRVSEGTFPRGAAWPVAILVGGVLFCAGYGMTVMTWEIGFHTTGSNNRTAIGAAIGTAWVFVGVAGWISTVPSTDRRRWAVFSVLISLLAGGMTLITGYVATFWVAAAREQEALVATLQERLPELPAGTTLLLDGICPFLGPAPVFVTSWDTRGMLRLTYRERTLRGDVLKPDSEWLPEGVRTVLFDDVIHLYPYGDDLIVFHAGTGASYPLVDAAAAERYVREVGVPGRVVCPPYTDGDGVEIY
jgi:hypothetical protein